MENNPLRSNTKNINFESISQKQFVILNFPE